MSARASTLLLALLCSQWAVNVSTYSEDAETYAKDIAAKVLRVEAAERAAAGQPFHTTAAQNNYPIVFIPGFLGWGPGELLGLPYFGGIYGDVVKILNAAGFTAFWVAGGKISSTWDRTCEDFAQIKGGVVDYGANHSAVFNHARFQRTHPGVYPQWGTTDANGNILKVHIVGHSEGGQDARLLTGLLNNGWNAEKNFPYPATAPISALFTGGHDWVASVTTIATPHDGTTFAADIAAYKNLVRVVVGAYFGLVGAAEPILMNIYDLMLDQWGLERLPTESITTYLERVMNSGIFFTTANADFSLFNLSPDGAQQINMNFSPVPHVFYQTYSLVDTFQLIANTYAFPYPDMFPVLIPISIIIGSFTRNTAGLVPLDFTWWPNDGLVNTRSEPGPTLGVAANSNLIVPFTGTLYSGKFNFLGTLVGWDHLAVIGLGDKFHVVQLYQNIANFLINSIPVVKNPTTATIAVLAAAPPPPDSNNATALSPISCQQDIQSYANLCGANAATQFPGLTLTSAQCQTLGTNVKVCKNLYPSSAIPSVGGGYMAALLTSALIAAWMIFATA